MPGIVGIIGPHHRKESAAKLPRMVQTMAHESFYASGTYCEERLGAWVAWTAIKGSFADGMPVWNDAGDIWMVFSGEHFSEDANGFTRNEQGQKSEFSRTRTMLAQYEAMGPAFLEKLNGWFSGVVVDRRKNRVILFNDRYGINRLYLHENSAGIYFASEAKALLEVLPQTRELDHHSLGEYFACGCVLQNRTLFSGISVLPPGSVWTFSPGHAIRKETYFKKETWENQPRLSAADYYEKLKATWTRILPRYFDGHQPVGLSLTGGVDSRMILAALPAGINLPCYTFGGMNRDCADVKIARKVAHLCEQSHETIPLDAGLFSEFPALAEKAVYLTDGTLDVTGATDLYVHRRVREIAPVRMTGLYGGEVLRGLVAFKPMRQTLDHLAFEFADCVRAAGETYADELKGHRQSFIAFKQAPWHIHSRLCIERTQVTIRTPYFDNELVALSYQAPAGLMGCQPALRMIAEARPSLRRVGTDRAAGIRGVPGFAQARQLLQQFTYKAEYAYDYGMPQWFCRLDRMASPLRLERLFLGRHKYYHFRLWYRDRVHRYLEDMLLDPMSLSRPYLRRDAVRNLVQDHLAGRRNYTLEIHRLLTAELVNRTLIERVPHSERGAGPDLEDRRSSHPSDVGLVDVAQ